MGLPSMTPVLGILDDCDRPEARMLVVAWGHPAAPMVEYLNPLIRPRGFSRRHNSFPSRFTVLARFGMSARFEPDGWLRVMPGPYLRTAMYPDGRPRRWQGRDIDIIEFRPQLGAHILKAVSALSYYEALTRATA